MSFMINRVSYSNSQLEKNSSKFDFDETIMIPKKHAVDNKKLTLKVAEQEKALTDERICLEKWIQKVSLQK